MDDPLALMLKFGFLAVLYLFLLWVARSATRDMARYDDSRFADDGPAPEAADGGARRRARDDEGMDLRSGVTPRLEILAALGHEPGSTYELGEGATMGRASASDIHVDDPFASSAHARIFRRGDFMFVEDMGSTNGTYLNGRQLRRAEQLRPADTVRIGDSEYRYQE